MKCLLLIYYRLEFGVRNCSKIAVETVYEPIQAIIIIPLTKKFQEIRLWAHLSKTLALDKRHLWLLHFEICYSENKKYCSIININFIQKKNKKNILRGKNTLIGK